MAIRDLVRRLPTVLAVAIAVQASVTTAKTYVAVPDVEWEALLPYVRANIVPELSGDEFHVFVCPEHTDRSIVTPFDEGLADFTRVLVTQGLRSGRGLSGAIEEVTDEFRAKLSTLGAEERAAFRDLYWESLSRSPDVLPRIRSLFESARTEGRLRCWLCDKVPDYAPAAHRIPPRSTE